MNGSYFIQAIIHVFKKMAHEKSFIEMMVEVILEITIKKKKLSSMLFYFVPYLFFFLTFFIQTSLMNLLLTKRASDEQY